MIEGEEKLLCTYYELMNKLTHICIEWEREIKSHIWNTEFVYYVIEYDMMIKILTK